MLEAGKANRVGLLCKPLGKFEGIEVKKRETERAK